MIRKNLQTLFNLLKRIIFRFSMSKKSLKRFTTLRQKLEIGVCSLVSFVKLTLVDKKLPILNVWKIVLKIYLVWQWYWMIQHVTLRKKQHWEIQNVSKQFISNNHLYIAQFKVPLATYCMGKPKEKYRNKKNGNCVWAHIPK